MRRLERWCAMGVNGAGKSTLLKLIAWGVLMVSMGAELVVTVNHS